MKDLWHTSSNPAHANDQDKNLKRLLSGIQKFTQEYTPGIFITAKIDPSDQRADTNQFQRAIGTETEALYNRGCFEETTIHYLPEHSCLLSSRFVLTLKNVDAQNDQHKPRLVAQRQTNMENPIIFHDSTTLKHSSLRIILSFASITTYTLWSQDISQAYIQSDGPLRHPIFVKPAKKLNLPKDVIWKLIKTLYRVCNSGHYCNKIFR